ncbi:BRO-N domain-containing protein [Nitrospirillum viridazoti]|uniref:BRO family protein n=1 Tax=Nitrospirillum amazonense TaxID=28077 RepID=A0A560IT64_9PROT|nr:BRO family protein [Nitrospirillum amazonense]TWB62252.1 BRO family protein [Nitrospirillum amazonense]
MTTHDITPFLFEGEVLVRAVSLNGDPWFVASDLALGLGYRDAERITRLLDDDEKGTLKMGTLGGDQSLSIVSEPGLYKAIGRSNKPAAKRFDRWVRHEVLPTIRKTGGYHVPDDRAHVMPPVNGQVQDMALNLRLITEARQTWGCKASQQMWLKINLPTVPAMFEGGGQASLQFDLAR